LVSSERKIKPSVMRISYYTKNNFFVISLRSFEIVFVSFYRWMPTRPRSTASLSILTPSSSWPQAPPTRPLHSGTSETWNLSFTRSSHTRMKFFRFLSYLFIWQSLYTLKLNNILINVLLQSAKNLDRKRSNYRLSYLSGKGS
jgi:hypothetical protein